MSPGLRQEFVLHANRRWIDDLKIFNDVDGDLQRELLPRLVSWFKHRCFPQKEFLYSDGDLPKNLFIITKGAVIRHGVPVKAKVIGLSLSLTHTHTLSLALSLLKLKFDNF